MTDRIELLSVSLLDKERKTRIWLALFVGFILDPEPD